VERARLSPLCIQDVRQLAIEVGRGVVELKERTGASAVDVIGVSQGGLASLYYVRRLAGTEHVRRLVTLGTPYGGTWLAVAGLPFLGAFSAGVWQSMPDSDLVKELAAAGPSPGEDVVSISRTGDPVATPRSCFLSGAKNVELPGTWLPATHQTLGFAPMVVKAALDALDG
jgi:pimeloyl-ACP methyl ester carboxylesterase